MNRFRLWLLCALVTGLAVSLAGVAPSAAETKKRPTIKEIQAAWQRRQEKIKAARVEWREKHVLSAGYFTHQWNMMPEMAKVQNPKGLFVPPKETTVEFPGSVIFTSKRCRLNHCLPTWGMKENKVISQPIQIAVDRGEEKQLLEQTSNSRGPSGVIGGPQQAFTPSGPEIRPIVFALAPMLRGLQIVHLSEYKVSDVASIVNSRACVQIEKIRHQPFDPIYRLVLDPSLDYNVVRQESHSRSGFYQRIDIAYQKQDGVHVPATWTILSQRPNPEKHQSVINARVTRCAINPRVSDADFELEFPPGTVYFDARSKKTLAVRPDGSKKEVDFSKDPDEWIKLDPAEKRRKWLRWLLIGVGATGVLVVLWLMVRQWRRGS